MNAKILLLILFGMIAGFAGFIYLRITLDGGSWPMSQSGGTISLQEQRTIDTLEQGRLDETWYNRAVEEKNTSLCDKIRAETLKVQCHGNVVTLLAALGKITGGCASISASGERVECEDTIAQKNAVEMHDIGACSKIVDVTKHSYCEGAVSENMLEKLISEKTVTNTSCQALFGSARDRCFTIVSEQNTQGITMRALTSGKVEDCTAIISETARTDCADIVLMSEAGKKNLPSLCNEIHNTEKRNQCQSRAGRVSDATTYKEAIQKEDWPLCNTISDTPLRTKCRDTVTMLVVRKTRDTTSCATIDSTPLRTACESLSQ